MRNGRPGFSLQADYPAVPVRFQAVGSAPILRQKVFKVSASQKFETVVNFLRKKLECKPTDSVFLYVNSVFAPGLDEGVGNLHRVSRSHDRNLFIPPSTFLDVPKVRWLRRIQCFKTDDQLIVAYSMTPAFG